MTRWGLRAGVLLGTLAIVAGAQTPGGRVVTSVAVGPADPAAAPLADEPMYDAANKRDPFRPPRVAPGGAGGEARTPLERYELGQLRLVAVIYDTGIARAVVEDDQGLGYIVKVGTRIGANGGEVAAIQRGRVVVREDYTDFYGQSHPSEAVLEMKTGERNRPDGGRKQR